MSPDGTRGELERGWRGWQFAVVGIERKSLTPNADCIGEIGEVTAIYT
jgi:hypothetical protein